MELQQVLSFELLAVFLHFPQEEKGRLLSALAGASKKGTPSILQPSAWLEIVTDTNANASNKSSLATKNSGLVANSDYISLW